MLQQKLLVIPSIHIKNGKCVRTVQGIPELDCYEYGNNPVEMAKIWRAENAKMIHVKDLDGAHEQSKRNIKVIEEICSSVVIPVEFAGGMRTLQDADEIMKTGVIRLAINTMAIENKQELIKVLKKYGPSKVVISLDILGEEFLIKGRSKKTGISFRTFSKEMVEAVRSTIRWGPALADELHQNRGGRLRNDRRNQRLPVHLHHCNPARWGSGRASGGHGHDFRPRYGRPLSGCR